MSSAWISLYKANMNEKKRGKAAYILFHFLGPLAFVRQLWMVGLFTALLVFSIIPSFSHPLDWERERERERVCIVCDELAFLWIIFWADQKLPKWIDLVGFCMRSTSNLKETHHYLDCFFWKDRKWPIKCYIWGDKSCNLRERSCTYLSIYMCVHEWWIKLFQMRWFNPR